MTKHISAVTIDKHYLEKKLWCVKLLYALVKPNGTKFWFVKDTLLVTFDKTVCKQKAYKLALEYQIPFIEGLKHGHTIKFSELAKLLHCGIEVK